MNELKEIVKRDTTICPRCKNGLVYIIHNTQLAVPGGRGQYISQIIANDNSVTAFCPICNSSYNLVKTIEGYYPEMYADNKGLIPKEKSRVKEISYNIIE